MIADVLGLAVAATRAAAADPATSVADEPVGAREEPPMSYPESSAGAPGTESAVRDLPLLQPEARS